MILHVQWGRLSALLVGLIFLVVFTLHLKTSHRSSPIKLSTWLSGSTVAFPTSTPPTREHLSALEREPWDSYAVLEGDEPTVHFRDRLRNDTSYITTWTDAGFTNIMMTYANLIYLASLSKRVPIIPPIVPYHHVDESAGSLLFSEIFDLPHLRSMLRRPILEWADVKAKPTDDSSTDSIGCWSAWATGNLEEHTPRFNTFHISSPLGLDVSFTALPSSTRRQPQEGGEDDWGLSFWELAALIYPSSSEDSLPGGLQDPFPSRGGVTLPPDTQLACFDMLYFVTAGRDDSYEWTDRWHPSWNEVGQHIKFKDSLVDLAKGYVRRAFDLNSLPPFIAVHVRHGDFGGACSEKDDCLASTTAYATRVKEVQRELFDKWRIEVPDHLVLVTSDETDPKFWRSVSHQGWRYIDHDAEKTHQIHGEWYITLVDIVSQSLSVGFVGTAGSTVSTVSQRRVEEWNNGVTRMVN